MEYLTVSEVAERLRIHEMTVRRHIKSGRLRCVRAGRQIRVPEEAILHFLEPTTSDAGIGPSGLKAWLLRDPTPEETGQRRDWIIGVESLQRPIDLEAATLIRVSRREDEVLYGDKTWKDLIAEES